MKELQPLLLIFRGQMTQIGLNKNDILENILVEKLVFGGQGFAKLSHSNPDLDGRIIFITGGAIPGSLVNLRVLKKRKSFIETQILEVIKKSPIEKIHKNNPYGMSGAWKWINIPYKEQLKIKENQVKEAFKPLEKFLYGGENEIPPTPLYQGGDCQNSFLYQRGENFYLDKDDKKELTLAICQSGKNFPLDKGGQMGILNKEKVINSLFLPIEPSPLIDGYRNKTEFSFGKYISHKAGIEKHFNLGFHRPGDFSKVEDFDGTPLIDEEQNEIFREIKSFTKTLGLSVYDTMKQEGFFRHLMFRKAYFTGEIMILLSFNPTYFEKNIKLNKSEKLALIKEFLINLTKKYLNIKSIYFSHNANKSDTAIGDLELVYGEKTIKEMLHGLIFNISPTSFFQTNSVGAEKLYEIVLNFANIDTKEKIVFDLYGGTGTIGMIFAKTGVKKVVSVELETSASLDGKQNAELNKLNNIEFVNAKVEDFLVKYLNSTTNGKEFVDLIIIDPPRAGMHPKALENILKFGAKQIIYVSCNPSTLVRDLEYFYQNNYKIEKIKPMDMFPHTHHIETVVSLKN